LLKITARRGCAGKGGRVREIPFGSAAREALARYVERARGALAGARTSPALASEVRAAIDKAIEYATTEMDAVIGESAVAQLLPVAVIAELAAAAFLGIEVLAQNGRQLDLDRLAATIAAAVQLVSPVKPA